MAWTIALRDANSPDKCGQLVILFPQMTPDAANLLTDLLKQVSRSFYTTLRVLPCAVRPQIGLAYLLARATDTIADTELVSVERRLGALQSLRDRILGQRKEALDFGELSLNQGEPAEKVLLRRIEEVITVLEGFSTADRTLTSAPIRRLCQSVSHFWR